MFQCNKVNVTAVHHLCLVLVSGQFGPIKFSASVFVGFMIATFTSILDSIGDYYACASMCHCPPPPAHAVNR